MTDKSVEFKKSLWNFKGKQASVYVSKCKCNYLQLTNAIIVKQFDAILKEYITYFS